MAKPKKNRKLLTGTSIGIGVGIVVAATTRFLVPSFFDRLENASYDYRYALQYRLQNRRNDQNRGPIEGIGIVDIDERSMAKLGLYYKWPRSHHGRVAELLSRSGAAAVTFDILFKSADFGASSTREILGILKTVDPKVNWMRYAPSIRDGLNHDSAFVESVSHSRAVIGAALMNRQDAYTNKSSWQSLATQTRHYQLNPQSAADWPRTLQDNFPDMAILDNIFPEFARACRRIALANVAPDPDGVHRSLPLFYNFPDPAVTGSGQRYTYPVLGLQTALYLIGRTMDDAEVVPGKYVDLGAPLRVWRREGELQTSYPGLTAPMLLAMMAKRTAIRALGAGNPATLDIATPIIVRRKRQAGLEVEILEGQVPSPAVLAAVRAADGEHGKLSGATPEDPVEIAPGMVAFIAEEAEGITVVDNSSHEDVYFDGYTLDLIRNYWPRRAIAALPEGGVLHVSSRLTLGYDPVREELTGSIPIFNTGVVEAVLALEPEDVLGLAEGDELALGESIRIPIDGHGRMLVHYQGPGGAGRTFRYYSYNDVLAGRLDPTVFQGKPLFLGSSAPALFDIITSPLEETYPGVELHATVLQNILSGDFMKRVDRRYTLIVLLAVGGLAGLLTYFLPILWAILAAILIATGYAAVTFAAFEGGWWLEFARPEITLFLTAFLVVMARYVFEERNRRFLHDAFKSYISPDLIDMMVESGNKPSLGGTQAELTAFFTDIQGFSTFSEILDSPTKLVELLNEYLSAMTDILLENKGTLDKYEGDAIIAVFGAPVAMRDHAAAACRTAIAMQEKLAELRTRWMAEGDKWPEIVHGMRMRIGINTGPIVTGNMGSRVRMNYTMMGDAVNLSARLESGAKQYGVYSLATEDTVMAAGSGIFTREIDLIRVMGKSKPVRIFELLAKEENAGDALRKCVNVFAEGLAHYRAQRWDDAIDAFRTSAPLEPNRPDRSLGCRTTPSEVFLDRCERFKVDRRLRIPRDWDGVFTATEK